MGKEVSVKAEKLFDKVVEFISHGSSSPFCLRCHYKTRKCIILAKIKKEVDKICNRQRSMCMFSACCNFYIFLRYSDGDMPFIFLNIRLKYNALSYPTIWAISLMLYCVFKSRASALQIRFCNMNCIGVEPT